ncbi:hypothetical protein BDU57DRAFT_438753 [Ampelomyces quisqualis]|uniref:Uncharacterized protein n=1 Tax=Ampelomyces quisqualis TaxID=50730 RepID=A0A6A5R045_AMPQU|nr:hypothetical protein BDU57DRAFT_438753 [Ampelomyces quisqualis]
MPAERRTFTATRPVKTERTHEENQERDRSLEARIESARRASEIHKKRTGRALRVTEQDVINEEMYEEEDDDLPTQYQRLNAHLHTTSVMFNKKLHDYIATQHGVRNMFMSQYQNPSFQPYGGQFSPNAANVPQTNNWLNPSMMPPQQFNPASPQQGASKQSQSTSNTSGGQQQGFRSSPYQIPQRMNSHQRSLSIQLPQSTASFDPSPQSAPAGVTTPQESFRRMSLPPHALEQQSLAGSDAQSRPGLSRSTTAQSPQQSVTPQTASPRTSSGHVTPQLYQDLDSASSYPFSTAGYPFSSQVLSTNPLAMSMPPESQQFIGSALDPNDPSTALFMAGSDNLPQPFAPTYTYNPNLSGKSGRNTADETLAPGAGIKTENVDAPSSTLPLSEGFFNNEALFTPGNGDYKAFFDFQGSEFVSAGDDQGDAFVNWD